MSAVAIAGQTEFAPRELPATRQEAREAGALRYFTGMPCIRDHLSERRTKDGNCIACQSAAARRERDPEGVRRNMANYIARNREQRNARQRERRKQNPAKRRALSRHGYTVADVQRLLESQRHRCANCRRSVRKKYHVDHVVPLAKGGSNGAGNIQILCPACNLSKGSKDPVVFAQQNGRLL